MPKIAIKGRANKRVKLSKRARKALIIERDRILVTLGSLPISVSDFNRIRRTEGITSKKLRERIRYCETALLKFAYKGANIWKYFAPYLDLPLPEIKKAIPKLEMEIRRDLRAKQRKT